MNVEQTKKTEEQKIRDKLSLISKEYRDNFIKLFEASMNKSLLHSKYSKIENRLNRKEISLLKLLRKTNGDYRFCTSCEKWVHIRYFRADKTGLICWCNMCRGYKKGGRNGKV